MATTVRLFRQTFRSTDVTFRIYVAPNQPAAFVDCAHCTHRPESLGLVCGIVYLTCIILFHPFLSAMVCRTRALRQLYYFGWKQLTLVCVGVCRRV